MRKERRLRSQPSNKNMELLKEIAALQTEYERLKNSGKMTKKAICDLVIPFRDKYHLSDKDALAIAQNKVSIAQMVTLLEAGLNRIVQSNKEKMVDVRTVQLQKLDFEKQDQVCKSCKSPLKRLIYDRLSEGLYCPECGEKTDYVLLRIGYYLDDDFYPSRIVAFSVSFDCLEGYLQEKQDDRSAEVFLETYDSDEAEDVYRYAADDGLIVYQKVSYSDEFEKDYADYIRRVKMFNDKETEDIATKEDYYYTVFICRK